MNYFVLKENKEELGPFTPQQIRELAEIGEIGPKDFVKKVGGSWYPANKVKGLVLKQLTINSAIDASQSNETNTDDLSGTDKKLGNFTNDRSPRVFSFRLIPWKKNYYVLVATFVIFGFSTLLTWLWFLARNEVQNAGKVNAESFDLAHPKDLHDVASEALPLGLKDEIDDALRFYRIKDNKDDLVIGGWLFDKDLWELKSVANNPDSLYESAILVHKKTKIPIDLKYAFTEFQHTFLLKGFNGFKKDGFKDFYNKDKKIIPNLLVKEEPETNSFKVIKIFKFLNQFEETVYGEILVQARMGKDSVEEVSENIDKVAAIARQDVVEKLLPEVPVSKEIGDNGLPYTIVQNSRHMVAGDKDERISILFSVYILDSKDPAFKDLNGLAGAFTIGEMPDSNKLQINKKTLVKIKRGEKSTYGNFIKFDQDNGVKKSIFNIPGRDILDVLKGRGEIIILINGKEFKSPGYWEAHADEVAREIENQLELAK